VTRALIGALLLLVVLPGPAWPAPQAAGAPARRERSAAQLVEDLSSDDNAVSGEAERRLVEMGAAAVPALMESLTEGEAPYSAHVLSRIGAAAEPALPLLRQRLRGKSPLAWIYAVAIARIKPAEAADVIPDLSATLDQGGTPARLSAMALGRIGTPAAQQALVARLKAPDRALRLVVARALAFHTQAERAAVLAVLLEALADATNDAERERAVLDIANLGRDAQPALPTLVHHYERGGRELRLAAAVAMAWAAPAVGVRVVPALLAGLDDPRPEARRQALEAIGHLGQPAHAHKAAVDRLLKDPVPSVQEMARAAGNDLATRRAWAQPLDALRLKAVAEPGVRDGRPRRAFFLAGTTWVDAEVGTWLHDGRVETIEPDTVVVAQDVVDERLRLTRRTVRLALFPAGTRPQPAQRSRSTPPVASMSLALSGDDVRDVVSLFGTATDLNLVLQHTARCAPQGQLLRAWPWDAALEHLLRECGLDHEVEGTFVRVASKADFKRFPYKEEKYTGHRITMEFARGRAPDLWSLFEDISGLKVEPHPEGESTLWCRECPWDEVFAALARSQGFGYSIDGAVIRLKRLP
jgi:HEAT repeat protein